MPKRVTLRDIAEVAGYHFTTVSLALRDDPSIPEPTRKKIKAAAESLGYKPDPVLSALVAYRQGRASPEYSGTITWLSNYENDYTWREIPLFCEYFSGVKNEAERRGYRVEEFDLKAPHMRPQRAQQILSTRGINGILIPPQAAAHTRIDLNWSAFSAVSFGYTLESPRLRVVSSNHFRMMVQLMEELHALGYRRPGLVMLKKSAERVENKWLAAYLGEGFRMTENTPMAPLWLERWNADMFDAWLDRERPDVIIAGRKQLPDLLPHLQQRGIAIPDEVGFADHNLADHDEDVAGMKQNAEQVGRVAVAVLIGLLHRNERGELTQAPIHTLVDGCWFPGPTVKPQGKRAARSKTSSDRQPEVHVVV